MKARSAVRVLAIANLLLLSAAVVAQPVPPGVLPEPPAGKKIVVHMKDLNPDQQSAVLGAQASRLARANRLLAQSTSSRKDEWKGVHAFEADEDHVGQLTALLRKAVPFSEVAGKFTVKLSRLEGPKFSDLALRGFVPEGLKRNGPWTWMTRMYSAADGSIVSISEWDFESDGGGILVIPETKNVEINGSLGELHVAVAPSGKELWMVDWSTSAKKFHLDLSPSSGMSSPKTRILEIARALQD